MIWTHTISPYIFDIHGVALSWYWFFYLFDFFICFWLAQFWLKKGQLRINEDQLFQMFTYGWLGLLIGARLFYVIAYYPSYYFENPGSIVRFWEGGMSFHGALIGLIISCWLLARKEKKHLYDFTDVLALCTAPALFFGRIGNFINGELWGRPTSGSWGVIFPQAGPEPRHPSQLYEAGLEGLAIFILIVALSKKKNQPGFLSWSFVLAYGLGRFLVEFFREPDRQLGEVLLHLSMGQWLCLVMIASGSFGIFKTYKPIKEARS